MVPTDKGLIFLGRVRAYVKLADSRKPQHLIQVA